MILIYSESNNNNSIGLYETIIDDKEEGNNE